MEYASKLKPRNNQVVLSPHHVFHCISGEWQTKFEIRIGMQRENIRQNELCHYQESALTEGATEHIKCKRALRGQHVTIQRVAAVPTPVYANSIMAPLILCEIEILASKGSL